MTASKQTTATENSFVDMIHEAQHTLPKFTERTAREHAIWWALNLANTLHLNCDHRIDMESVQEILGRVELPAHVARKEA